ncbi:MAG: SURF1 family protein [Gammaproteobacteria bacterium]|nr:SURF1 family protein [Gammaproteobacteria bacterium]
MMVVCVVAFSWLAVWQYHRAQEREARIAAVEAARDAPPILLMASTLDTLQRYAHLWVKGRYIGTRQVLLMEMTRPGGTQVGYEVLTPLKLASGKLLLVNRGWVPKGRDGAIHADLSVPEQPVRAAGFLAPLPRPGLNLGGNPAQVEDWPARLLFPTWEELDRLYGPHLLHRMMLLAPEAKHGFARDWKMQPRYGPHQNYGYMVQWIAFAVIVFGLWLWFSIRNLRRRRRT